MTFRWWAFLVQWRAGKQKKSDIDLIVRFSKRKSLLTLVRLERELSEALGRKVDLLTEAAISPYFRERILKRCRWYTEKDDTVCLRNILGAIHILGSMRDFGLE